MLKRQMSRLSYVVEDLQRVIPIGCVICSGRYQVQEIGALLQHQDRPRHQLSGTKVIIYILLMQVL